MTGMSIASGAGSHVLAPLTAATVLRAWQFSPAVSALLLGLAAAYLTAARRVGRRHPRPLTAREGITGECAGAGRRRVLGALNGALAATLAGFGEQFGVLILYGGAAAVIEVIAVVLWLSQRRRPGPPAWRLSGHGGNVLLLAAGVLVAGLAWAFTWYLAAVAVLPLAIAGGREAFARRHWGP